MSDAPNGGARGTPRTDEAVECGGRGIHACASTLIEESRKLERELAEAVNHHAALVARAKLADELADMVESYRDALYDGPANLGGLTNDRLETEANALLARHAAAKEAR